MISLHVSPAETMVDGLPPASSFMRKIWKYDEKYISAKSWRYDEKIAKYMARMFFQNFDLNYSRGHENCL